MDTYLSGSIKILEVENEDLKVHIFGEDIDKLMENKQVNLNISATVKLLESSSQGILKTITSSGELVVNEGIKMMPMFFEDGNYELIIESKGIINNFNFIQNGLNINKYFKTVSCTTFGSLKFRSDVGYTNLDIYSDNRKLMSIMLEVFPSKMDYQKDYMEMISEVNEEIAGMAFQLLDKTYLESMLVDKKNQTETEFVNILDHIFESFESSLKFLVNNFKHNIVEYEKILPLHKSRRISRKTSKYLRTRPHLLEEDSRGFIQLGNNRYIPRKVIERKKKTTIDIFENQMVKYIIKEIIKRIESLENILVASRGLEYRSKVETRYRLSYKKKMLEGYLRNYFENIKDIYPKNTMSLVFQMSPGYKDVYKKYVILSKGLDLGDDLFKITPKKIYELYEIWSYIKLHKILYDLGYGVNHYGIVEHKDNGLYLKLNTDQEAAMVYEKGNQALRLWYNKNYSGPTTRQRPDTVLYIENLTSDENRTYIFDAKYRLKVDSNGMEGPLEEDINIMHRYRDAIVSKLSDGFKYKYETFGAYVMFPCTNEEKFKNHKFYKSIEEINIGALPMLPGATGLITRHLEKILSQSDLEAKEDRLVLDEFDDYSKFKGEDVMVVNSKDPEHLKAYIENNFYHIPEKYLSNARLGVEYIAFYQPKSKFGDQAGIRYYARIKDILKYRRGECEELPLRRNREEVYLRFNLGEIEGVGHIEPIQLAPRLISYTTFYLLNNAENMHELKIKNSLEMKTYKILREFSERESLKLLKINNKYELGKDKVEIIDGKHLRINGELVAINLLREKLEKRWISERDFI